MSILTTAQIANLKKETSSLTAQLAMVTDNFDSFNGRARPMKRMLALYQRPSDIVPETEEDPIEAAAQLISAYDIYINGPGDDDWGEELEELYPRLRELNPSIEIFVYIAMSSAHADNLTNIAEFKEDFEPDGIFIDEFGYYYEDEEHYATRRSTNELIDLCHTLQMKVMVNGPNSEYKFGVEVMYDSDKHIFYNEFAEPSSLNEHDYHMWESMFCYRGDDPGEQIFIDHTTLEYYWNYYHEVRDEPIFEGKSFFQYYGTQSVALNYMAEDHPKRQSLATAICYLSLIFNVVAIFNAYEQDNDFRVPTDREFYGGIPHTINKVLGSGSPPKEYRATVGSVELQGRWDPNNNEWWIMYNGTKIFVPVGTSFHALEPRITEENRVLVEESSYNVKSSDGLVQVTYSTSEETTITLPHEILEDAKKIIIKDSGGNASVNNIIIQSVDLIDGASERSIEIDFGSITLYSDGDTWISINGVGGTSNMQDYVSSTVKTWVLGETYTLSNVTYDDDGIIDSANIQWPDGSAGLLQNVVSDEFGIFSIEYTRSGITYTLQVIRDSDGNVQSTNFI